jgi:hypothetical protein
MEKRAQVSTEVLILVGLMLTLLIPLLVYSYGRANTARDDMAVQKAEFAVQRLASLSDSVGYIGGSAAIVEEIEMPPGARALRVEGHDVIIELGSPLGARHIVQSSAFTLASSGLGNITTSGTYFIEVASVYDSEAGAQRVRLALK